MFEIEVLIGEGVGAVDRSGSSPVSIEKIASLNHEVVDLLCLEEKQRI